MAKASAGIQIEGLLNDLVDEFPARQTELGFMLYLQKQVTDADIQTDLAFAHVSESETKRYAVRINPLFTTASTCTCGASLYCEHMAALIFYLCAKAGERPELILRKALSREQAEQLRVMKTEKRKQAMALRKKKEKLEAWWGREKDLKMALDVWSTPSDWEQWFDKIRIKYKLFSEEAVEALFAEVKQEGGLTFEEGPVILSDLFRIFIHLKLVRAIDEWKHEDKQQVKYGYYAPPSHRLLDESFHALDQYLRRMDGKEAYTRYGSYVQLVLPLLQEEHFNMTGAGNKGLRIYRLLWSVFGGHSHWVKKEKERLLAKEKNPDHYHAVQPALMMFEIADKRDEQVFSRLAHWTPAGITDYIYPYMAEMEKDGELERLLTWLIRLKPYMLSTDAQNFRKYCAWWVACLSLKRQDVEKKWMETLQELLPRSYYYYARHLQKQGCYHDWCDLTMALGIGLDALDERLLQEAEQKDPASVLPLYHQYIEQCILQKHRHGYKAAIKMLKKLRSCYLSLNKEQTWHRYMEAVEHKFARLRALQEEIRKGNLRS